MMIGKLVMLVSKFVLFYDPDSESGIGRHYNELWLVVFLILVLTSFLFSSLVYPLLSGDIHYQKKLRYGSLMLLVL